MNQFLRTVSLAVTTIWVGGLIWIGLVFAPYLFILASRNSATVPNSGVAAGLIGPLLYGSDVVGLLAALFIGSILLWSDWLSRLLCCFVSPGFTRRQHVRKWRHELRSRTGRPVRRHAIDWRGVGRRESCYNTIHHRRRIVPMRSRRRGSSGPVSQVA
jgi:hypothetical protein